MSKYRVEYSGSVEVEASSALEAECEAATMCRPDNCRAEDLGDDEPDDREWSVMRNHDEF